jgi:Rps23 Pro-64 3,4-dihydroxylase Tpa1-like proline 4-hydroxylase
LQHEAEFQASKVLQLGSSATIDHQRRKSRVILDLQQHHAVIVDRIKSVLPWVFNSLRLSPFRIGQIECQLTVSNDGEFFKAHNDNSVEEVRTRELTFIYYFYREPKAFAGGELQLYDSYCESGRYIAGESYQTLLPQQNRIVFFPSCLIHEVLPVSCPSRLFADSRFTVNGWLYNAKQSAGLLSGWGQHRNHTGFPHLEVRHCLGNSAALLEYGCSPKLAAVRIRRSESMLAFFAGTLEKVYFRS